jgi:uncharacterized MAPEG superfamily protein
MAIELRMLALSILLGFVHILLSAHYMTCQYGLAWNISARDKPMPPLEVLAGRLQRATRNFSETFPLFAAAVLTALAAGKQGTLTDWGVQLYFWGRVIYLLLYAFGVPILRTVVWTVAMAGIILNLAALL